MLASSRTSYEISPKKKKRGPRKKVAKTKFSSISSAKSKKPTKMSALSSMNIAEWSKTMHKKCSSINIIDEA